MNTRNRRQAGIWIRGRLSQAQGECVEIKYTPGAVHARDSKNTKGPVLTFTPDAWSGFLDTLTSDTSDTA